MAQRYDLEKVKDLLTEVFTDEELRRFCYDTPNFIPVYNQLGQDTTKSQIIDRLIKHADRKLLLETLLDLIKERNLIIYEKYQPYYDLSDPSSDPIITSSATEPAEPSDKVGASTEKIRFSSPLRVFLCHASEDKSTVRNLYYRLRAEGLDPWLDEINLLPGQKWRREIPKAVRSADIVLVCLSNNSITKAGYVRDEITYALGIADKQPEDTIFIIPLKLEKCEVPERLRDLQWVNLFEDTGYDRLIDALQVRAQSLKKGIALKGRLLKAARDPMWQMIGVIIAILALVWAVYTFFAGEGISGLTTPTGAPGLFVPPPTLPMIATIKLVPDEGSIERRVVSTEEILQNNCGGDTDLTTTIERSRSIAHTIQVGEGVTVRADGSISGGLPAGIAQIELSVGAAVEATYNVAYGKEEVFSSSLDLVTAKRTRRQFTIQHIEQREVGQLVITSGDQELNYPYSFPRGFAMEQINTQEVECP